MATQSFNNTFKITTNYGLKNLTKAFENYSKANSIDILKIEKKMASTETIRKILKK